MKVKQIEVDILYYIEDNDLVIHCPQLGVYGVADKEFHQSVEHDRVTDALKKKLDRDVGRFNSPSDFTKSLLFHGHWYEDSVNGPQPKKLDYFMRKFSYLGKTMERSNVKTMKHSFDIPMP